MSDLHVPVMAREVLTFFLQSPRTVVVDCTLGEGGHSHLILSEMKEVYVLGIDVDEEALFWARNRLSRFRGRFSGIKGDYRKLGEVLAKAGVPRIDGALFDLGVSSRHLDLAERGFSFRETGPLDMRMDRTSAKTAEHVVNEYPVEEIERILKEYGEERFAGRIARAIARRREQGRLLTTDDLSGAVFEAVGRGRSRVHPARRTFQAFRIEVNDELSRLKPSLLSAYSLLRPEGILAVLSYHSLEDRLVKEAFRWLKETEGAEVLTKKPLVPSEAERRENPRSKSAKLRIIERK